MTTTKRWITKDLEALPDEPGTIYEIIDGELIVSKQPRQNHQEVAMNIGSALGNWSKDTGSGKVSLEPGLIFADDNNLVPDAIWISHRRRALYYDITDHKYHGAPDLAVEILSLGSENEQRDKVDKLRVYSRRGVDEYWIVDVRAKMVEVYRRDDSGSLALTLTLHETDKLISPTLPGFVGSITDFFADLLPE